MLAAIRKLDEDGKFSKYVSQKQVEARMKNMRVRLSRSVICAEKFTQLIIL